MAAPSNERTIELLDLVDYGGDVLVMTTATAAPPGSRVAFSLTDDNHGAVASTIYRGKLVSLRKDPTGNFELKVRLHNMSRPQRELLEERIRRSTGG
jgi:hypothetical protein